MPDGLTWYDILGISPGASSATIRRAYEDKVQQLRPDRIAGAPANVIAAATRGRQALDGAWRVLGDRATRERYDDETGIRRKGQGLARPEPVPAEQGWSPPNVDIPVGDLGTGEVLGGLAALVNRLSPRRSRPQRVVVPDVRGLLSGPCRDVVTKAGLRLRTVQLTEHPMPVEGLAVDQAPPAGEWADRASALTVYMWHPPRSQPPQ